MVGSEKLKFLNKVKTLFLDDIEEDTINTNSTDEQLNAFFSDNISISGSKLTSTTYYSCMQIRCNAIAKLPLKIMQYAKKGARKATEHDLYKIFSVRPNPFVNTHDFLWATEFQRLEYGNAFWVMDILDGKIKALYLLDSPNVSIMIDDTGILDKPNSVYYVYNDAKHGSIIYSSENITHFKNFSYNGLIGTSIKKYLSDTIENEQYSTNILRQKYKNGLQDPIIIEFAGDLNKSKQKSIQKRFANLGGAENAGRVIPIPVEFQIKQLETKLVNSQFFDIQGLTTRRIANAFGVKGFQLNDMEKSTYNNIEQQNKAFYSDTLQNVLTSYEQEIDYKLLSPKERERGFYSKFNVDSILRSDLTSRTSSYVSAIASGYMTIAEVREKEDMPYIEGTDKLIIGNGASIYLNDLGKQYGGGGD